MIRRAVGIAGILALVAALGLSLTVEDGARSHRSLKALGRDIAADGAGCSRIYPTGVISWTDRESGTCLVGQKAVTLHRFNDISVMDDLEEPSLRSGVTWVVGPNWLVATMDRPAAVRVMLAIGGELRP